MPNPTRTQIESVFALPKFKVEVYTPGTTWVTVSGAMVASIQGSVDATNNNSNGLAFGSPSEPSADFEVEDHILYSTYYLSDVVWINRPARISFGFDTSDYVLVFYGPIKSISKNNQIVRINIAGTEEHLRQLKLHTAIFYRRAIATKTTAASDENPSTNTALGLVNMAFWNAGGRPYEQKNITYFETDVDWKFWYSCEASILSPDYAWFSGDTALDELYSLARAGGGQVYQDNLGVMRYSQPLLLAETSGYGGVYYTFDDSTYVDFQKDINNNEQVGTIKVTFTQRRIQPEQVIIEDKSARNIKPSASISIELTPQLPIWSYTSLAAADIFKAVLLDNNVVIPTISSLEYSANKVSMTVTNPNSVLPLIINTIIIKGRPLEVGEENTVVYGSGDPVRNAENNIYVQNIAHAERLARMIYDFYTANKPVITLTGVQYDTDRFVGELVKLDTKFISDSTIYRIVRLSHENIGTSMSVGLVPVTNIPIHSNMFIIGDTYIDADVRQLSY